jgi:hypothetical protein
MVALRERHVTPVVINVRATTIPYLPWTRKCWQEPKTKKRIRLVSEISLMAKRRVRRRRRRRRRRGLVTCWEAVWTWMRLGTRLGRAAGVSTPEPRCVLGLSSVCADQSA